MCIPWPCWPCRPRPTLLLEPAREPAREPEAAPARREPAVEGLPPPSPAPPRELARVPAPPARAPTPPPRAPRCSRSAHGTERRVETEHYRYRATRPAHGGPWPVKVTPLSAAARYHAEAHGEAPSFTCPLAELPDHIGATERALGAYWGHVLDTRPSWG